MKNRLSEKGLAFLKHAEGFSPTMYPDAGGYSIGYGCLLSPKEIVKYREVRITEAEAERLLAGRLVLVEAAVDTAVRVSLWSYQFDALVIFAYNVGAGAFRGSTLVRKLNSGDTLGASAEFPRWNKSQGKVCPALIARRKEERKIFDGSPVKFYG